MRQHKTASLEDVQWKPSKYAAVCAGREGGEPGGEARVPAGGGCVVVLVEVVAWHSAFRGRATEVAVFSGPLRGCAFLT